MSTQILGEIPKVPGVGIDVLGARRARTIAAMALSIPESGPIHDLRIAQAASFGHIGLSANIRGASPVSQGSEQFLG